MPVLDAHWIERRLGVARTTKQQERLADGEFLCCRPVYVGRNILLCGRKDGVFPFQCLVGPDWPCMVITYFIITVPTVAFFILVASQINWVALLLGVVSFSMTILCFSLTACSDPGIVYRHIVDEELGSAAAAAGSSSSTTTTTNGSSSAIHGPEAAPIDSSQGGGSSSNHFVVAQAGSGGEPPAPLVVHAGSRSGAPADPTARIPCSRCEMSRPMGASHCYDCEVCVKGLDHHCPWTGKCIGQRNLCFFYAFLICLTVHILYVGVVTGMNAITTGFKLHDNQ